MPQDLDSLRDALKDRYTVERELGRGGMATVYLAHDKKLGRAVALKVLKPELAAALGGGRFVREIEIAARLTHPHILGVHDSGEADGILYYTMPYVEGESLRERLTREHQLPLEDTLQITREVADALGYAHALGIVHRDIKPENILFTGGHAVVADFGIARAVTVAGGETLTGTGLAIGTPAYMSPEQAAGSRELDGRTDLYSLGCVVYEMLSGETPYSAPTPQALIAKKLSEPLPRISIVREAVPRAVETALSKALAKTAADRYRTAADFVAALTVDPAVFERRHGMRRGMRRVAAAIGVLALVAAAVALGRLAPSSKSEMTTGLLPHLIAVFPFDVQAGPEQQHLGFAMMTLLSYSLDGVGQLRTTDPQALTGELEHSGGMTADVERAREIARQLRAGHYVLGTVVGAGSGVAVTWSLYDTERGGMAVGTNSVTGAVEDVRFMATGVARQLLTQRALIAPSQFSPPVAELGTESYQALVAYLCGVEHLLRGRYDSAVLALERAVAEDSTFAQAWYRLLWAYDWAQTDRVARRDPIQRLRRLRGKLSVKERLIVDIQTAWETGDAESMERLALQATTQFPDYLESWYHLGLVRDFFRWRQPQPLDAALDAYARAFALDPTYPQLLWNYSWALRRGRQHVLVDSLYDQARARGSPIVFTTAHDAFTAYLFGGETARDSVIGVLDRGFSEHTQVPLHSTVWTNQWLHSTSDSLALARRLLWAVMVDPQRRPPDTQALGHRYLATVALAAGRWREAMTEAAASARAQPELAVLGYGLLALTPFVPLARADLVALRDSLLQVRSWPVMFRDIGPDLRSYLLGVLSARLGEETAALRYAAALEQGAASADSARLASDLALEIRAMVESARNRPDDALRTLEGQRLGLPDADGIGSRWLYPFVMLRPLGRLLRAELLLQSGRYEEALRWFDSYPSLNGEPIVDWAYLSHTYGRMAEIHEALGRNDSAIAYYNRLIARWKNADSLLQPRVAAARAAVRRLGAEGRE